MAAIIELLNDENDATPMGNQQSGDFHPLASYCKPLWERAQAQTHGNYQCIRHKFGEPDYAEKQVQKFREEEGLPCCWQTNF